MVHGGANHVNLGLSNRSDSRQASVPRRVERSKPHQWLYRKVRPPNFSTALPSDESEVQQTSAKSARPQRQAAVKASASTAAAARSAKRRPLSVEEDSLLHGMLPPLVRLGSNRPRSSGRPPPPESSGTGPPDRGATATDLEVGTFEPALAVLDWLCPLLCSGPSGPDFRHGAPPPPHRPSGPSCPERFPVRPSDPPSSITPSVRLDCKLLVQVVLEFPRTAGMSPDEGTGSSRWYPDKSPGAGTGDPAACTTSQRHWL